MIEWESKEKECTHIKYVYINERWYLLACFLGVFELYCEDGSKKYFQGKVSGYNKDELLTNAVFLSSCVATNNNGEEYLILGTSVGEIY